MMSVDRYVYPGTGILRNKFDITDVRKAESVERQISGAALMKLRQRGVTGGFDSSHIQALHREIFGDIYDWAGEFRDIPIYKGGMAFAMPSEIEERLQSLFNGVHRNDCFTECDIDGLAESLTRTMAELNMIHPFREGNGRVQRVFVEQLALNAGYQIAP